MGLTDQYAYYLKIERAMSPNTTSSYLRDILAFLQWYQDEAEGTDLSGVNSDYILDYFKERKDLSKRSQARLLSALRSFFSWAVQEDRVSANPCDGVDMPKLGRYIPSVLSVEEVEALIDSTDGTTLAGLRDRALLELLYGCGLRVSEAATLKSSDV